MIVLVLVLIWLVVLAPAISHRLSSSNVFSSILRFRADTHLLRKILGHREDVIPFISSSRSSSGLSHRELALRNAESARRKKERQRTMARRRRAVGAMLGATFGFLVLGAVPSLHLLWLAAGFFILALIAYLVLLARFTQHSANAAERRVKVVELPRTVFPVVLNGSNSRVGQSVPVTYRVAYTATVTR